MSTIEIDGENYKSHRNYPLRIATFNDMHVSSWFGLHPLETKRQPDLNEGQLALQKDFINFTKQCQEVKPNLAWIPGDMMAGKNPKEGGRFVMNIELNEQIELAALLIAQLCEKVPSIQEVGIWEGTGYHGSRDVIVEDSVAKTLRADYDINAKFYGTYSYVHIKYRDCNKRIFITHTAPDANMYPEQAMGKDMMLWQEGVAKGKLKPVDMIIRAHKHEFIEVHKASIRALQLPCWQFFVPYDTAMKNFAKYQPDIGSVILLFDDKLRTSTWHFIYPNIEDPERLLNVELDKGVGFRRLLKKL